MRKTIGATCIVMGIAIGLVVLPGCSKKEKQPAQPNTPGTTRQQAPATGRTGAQRGQQTALQEADQARVAAEKAAQQAQQTVVQVATEQTICPVMKGPINKELFVEYKGKKVYFCCADCKAQFEKDPEKYVKDLPQFIQ